MELLVAFEPDFWYVVTPAVVVADVEVVAVVRAMCDMLDEVATDGFFADEV